jgi:tetratricopeptide (TPR) repeat protein
VGQLIGLDFSASPLLAGMLSDGRQIRDRAFQAAAQLLRRLAASDDSPLVMLLDDLHWADDGSLDFVAHLLQQQRDLPLLLVMLARPALFERRANWVLADAPHRRIDVMPLGAEDSGALTDALLQRMAEVPEVLRALLTSRAEGNPFYMEELVKMLIDDGVIRVDADGWQVRAERLLTAPVPATLTGVLQARIDALAPVERSALQHAAVVGHVFWDAALETLEPGAASALANLLRKELIVQRDGSAFDDAVEYSFGHHLLHQVCYETVLKAPRRAGHAAAAAWLAQRLGERTNEFLAVAAEHYDRAGDEGQALEFFEKAANDASVRFANASALAHAERALANPRLTDLRRRWGLLVLKVALLDRQGNRPLQQAALAEREALADALDDDGLRASARLARALLADRLGDHASALPLAHEAWALAERADNVGSAAVALCEIAWVHRVRGELDLARAYVERGLSWARRMPSEPYTVQLLLVAIAIAKSANDYAASGLLLDQAREAVRASPSSRRSHGHVLLASSQHASALGDWPQAQLHAEAALQANRDIGLAASEASTLCMLSECAREQGDPQAALAFAEAALAIFVRLIDPFSQALAWAHVGRAQGAAGAWTQALAAFEQALALYEAVGGENGTRATIADMAEAHLECGDRQQALPLVEQVLRDSEEGDEQDGEIRIALICHRVFEAAQDPRADRMLARAHDALQALAARIGDATVRARMLDKIPAHRAVAEAWSRRTEAGLRDTPPA